MSATLTGAAELKAYLTRLQSDIPKAIERATISPDQLQKIEQKAKQIVLDVVYAAYTPAVYERTFALLNSVKCVALSGNPPSAALILDLTAESAAIAGAAAGSVPYGRFMLTEFSFGPSGSFLQYTVPQTLPREFRDAWQQAIGEITIQDMLAEIDLELARK